MWYFVFGGILLTGFAILYNKLYGQPKLNPQKDCHRYPSGTHVVISGGSKGIGKSLAIKYAELGTHVTIIARNENDLKSAKETIEKSKKSHVQQIRTVSLDLTKISYPDDSQTERTREQDKVLEMILGEHDRCDILINCCGQAITGRFEDISQSQFEQQMQVNYFSAVNLTRLLLPVMKRRSLSYQNNQRHSSDMRIVFVSSMCGVMGFFGYSAYAASKFALVGLAESLHMELKPFNIGVTISFPPDTDTPGFEIENRTKPQLTKMISEMGNVYQPDEVAKSLIIDIRLQKFYSTVGTENLCVLTCMNAFMPDQSFMHALIDSILITPIRLVIWSIVRSWYNMVEQFNQSEILRTETALRASKN